MEGSTKQEALVKENLQSENETGLENNSLKDMEGSAKQEALVKENLQSENETGLENNSLKDVEGSAKQEALVKENLQSENETGLENNSLKDMEGSAKQEALVKENLQSENETGLENNRPEEDKTISHLEVDLNKADIDILEISTRDKKDKDHQSDNEGEIKEKKETEQEEFNGEDWEINKSSDSENDESGSAARESLSENKVKEFGENTESKMEGDEMASCIENGDNSGTAKIVNEQAIEAEQSEKELEKPASPEIGFRKSMNSKICSPDKSPEIGSRRKLRVHVFESELTSRVSQDLQSEKKSVTNLKDLCTSLYEKMDSSSSTGRTGDLSVHHVEIKDFQDRLVEGRNSQGKETHKNVDENEPCSNPLEEKECQKTTNEEKECQETTTEEKECSEVTTEEKECLEMSAKKKECQEMTTEEKECQEMTTEKKECQDVTTEEKECQEMSAKKKECQYVTTEEKECQELSAKEKDCQDMTTEKKECQDMTTEEKECQDMTPAEKEFQGVTTETKECQEMSAKEKECQDMTTEQKECRDMTTEQKECQDMATEQKECQEVTTEQKECREMTTEEKECQDMTTEEKECQDMTTEEKECQDMTTEEKECQDMTAEEKECRDMTTEEKECRDVTIEEKECQNMTTEEKECQDMTAEEKECRDMTTEEKECRDMTTEEKECQDMTTEEKECRDMTTEEKECQDMTTEEKECRDMTTEEKECQDTTTEEKECPEMTTEEKEYQDVTTEEKECQEVTTEEKECQDMTTEEKECQEVTTEEKECPKITTEEKDCRDVTSEEKECQDMTSKEKECQDVTTEEKECQDVTTGEKECQEVTTKEKECSAITTEEKECQDVTTEEKECQDVTTEEKECQEGTTKEKECPAITTEEKECPEITTEEKDCRYVTSEEKECQEVTTEEKECQEGTTKEKECPAITTEEKECPEITTEEKDCRNVTSEEKECQEVTTEEKECQGNQDDEKECQEKPVKDERNEQKNDQSNENDHDEFQEQQLPTGDFGKTKDKGKESEGIPPHTKKCEGNVVKEKEFKKKPVEGKEWEANHEAQKCKKPLRASKQKEKLDKGPVAQGSAQASSSKEKDGVCHSTSGKRLLRSARGKRSLVRDSVEMPTAKAIKTSTSQKGNSLEENNPELTSVDQLAKSNANKKVDHSSEQDSIERKDDVDGCPVNSCETKVECIHLSSDDENVKSSVSSQGKMNSKVCKTCRSVWNDEVLRLIFKGTECVTVNSKITYGAIICIKSWINRNYQDDKEQAITRIFERANLGSNIAKLNVSKLDQWLANLLESGKNKCCDVFTAVYGSDKDLMLRKKKLPMSKQQGSDVQKKNKLVQKPDTLHTGSNLRQSIESNSVNTETTSGLEARVVRGVASSVKVGETMVGQEKVMLVKSSSTSNLVISPAMPLVVASSTTPITTTSTVGRPVSTTTIVGRMTTPSVALAQQNSTTSVASCRPDQSTLSTSIVSPMSTQSIPPANQNKTHHSSSSSPGQSSTSVPLNKDNLSGPENKVAESVATSPVTALNKDSPSTTKVEAVNLVTPSVTALGKTSSSPAKVKDINTTTPSVKTSLACLPEKGNTLNVTPSTACRVESGTTHKIDEEKTSSKVCSPQKADTKMQTKSIPSVAAMNKTSPPFDPEKEKVVKLITPSVDSIETDTTRKTKKALVPSKEQSLLNKKCQAADLKKQSNAKLSQKTDLKVGSKVPVSISPNKTEIMKDSKVKQNLPVDTDECEGVDISNANDSDNGDSPSSGEAKYYVEGNVTKDVTFEVAKPEGTFKKQDKTVHLLTKLGLNVNNINIYASYMIDKPITNGFILNVSSPKDRSSPCYFSMLKERSALYGFALNAFDLLLYESHNHQQGTETEAAANRFVTKRELLTLQSICILNAEMPDVTMFYQIFIQILLSRNKVLLIPDSRTLLFVTENIRKEYNRAKSRDLSVQILNENWDPDSIYSAEDLWLNEERCVKVTNRDVLSVFCTWRNLEKKLPDPSFTEALQVLCKNLDMKRVDKIGVCVNLYAKLCRYLYEEKDFDLAQVFLNEPFTDLEDIVAKDMLRTRLKRKKAEKSKSIAFIDNEKKIEAFLEKCLALEKTATLSPNEQVYEEFCHELMVIQEELKQYKAVNDSLCKILKVAVDKKENFLKRIKNPRIRYLSSKLKECLETTHKLLNKRKLEEECATKKSNKRQKICHNDDVAVSDGVSAVEVSTQSKKLVKDLLSKGIKPKQITKVITTILASVGGKEQLKLPSEKWIRNFAKRMDMSSK